MKSPFLNYRKKEPIKAFEIKFTAFGGGLFCASPTTEYDDCIQIDQKLISSYPNHPKRGQYLIEDKVPEGSPQTYSVVSKEFFEANYQLINE